METPAAAPMSLACQSLLVRDDGGDVRHPFRYGGAGPTSPSELKHRISEVVSNADHAMLRKDSIDLGFISPEVRPVCFLQPRHIASNLKVFVSHIEIPVEIPSCLSQSSLGSFHTHGLGHKSLPKGSAARHSRLENKGEQRISEYRYG